MISDAEFVAIKAFDRTLAHSVDHGQRIINAKNRRVNSADARLAAQAQYITSLEAALAAEKAKNASMLAQVSAMLQRRQ